MAVLPGKHIPQINSQEVLIELVTNLIYTASAGHGAINFNQYGSVALSCACSGARFLTCVCA